MKFLKKKLGPKKPLIATVVEIVCVGPTQRTWAEDDPEQLKLANQTFLDAALVEYDPDDTTQSAFILDESIREATHPDAIRRRRLQAAAAAQDSDDELSIELPPELSMMADDPVMLEAIIAQRQWERQQRRSRQAMEGEMDSSDEEDYDFDSEYSSGEEEEEEDDNSYASAAASSYNEDSEAEEEDDRSASEPDISDDNGSYRSRSSREEEDARDSASLSSAGETASRISLQMEDDDDSYDSRNHEDDQSTLQPQDDHFSDEEMSQEQTPIDAGRVRDEHKSSPEEDGYASNHDDDRRSRSQSFSAHAERYHSEDDEHDEHDAYSQSEDDRSRYSRASNSTRNSYREDLDNHSYRDHDDEDRSYASSVRSFPESVRSEDDDYSVEDRKPAAVNYDDEDDDYSRSSRSQNSYEDDISLSRQDDDASVDKTEFENGDLSTRSRSARYDDDAYLHHREEEEERELETLEEARRNLPDGEQMHPFLLEHYMALKERKEARKRLSQRMGRTVGY